MGVFSRATILFVDDDACMREVMGMILDEEGYEVITAIDGFDGLAVLRATTPDLIISDLHMPYMSGFEFLSIVRRRFPAIPVIAISGAHEQNESFPVAVMADAFYPKGRCHPDELMQMIAQLLRAELSRPTNYHPSRSQQVQIVRKVRDVYGAVVMLLTCTDCLRSFAVDAAGDVAASQLHAACAHCGTLVDYTDDCSAVSLPATFGTCEEASAA